ncbi:RhoGAP-domain-containing protein [Backusella circina FSU 941]|nr:RhoGAP-domain-containing protein [Backusella circina FSU 941]
MLHIEPISDKKRHSSLFSFLCNGKHQIISTVVCYPSTHSIKEELEEARRGIFRTPLRLALKYSAHIDPGLYLPIPIYRCFEEIFKRGLTTEGIFRLSGAAHEVKELQKQLDRHPTFGKSLDLSKNDIHAIAGVAKLYLRQLPDPVIPVASHQHIIKLFDDAQNNKPEITKVASIIHQLPREHFHLIYYIILLATHIQRYSYTNMMNAEALSVVLSPVLTGLEQNLKEMPPRNKKNVSAKLDYMGQLVLTNSKWSGIWTLLISEGDILLNLWNNTFSKCEWLLKSYISSELTQPLLLPTEKSRNRESSEDDSYSSYIHDDDGVKLSLGLSGDFNVMDMNSRTNIRRCSYEYKMNIKSLPCVINQFSTTI